MRRMLAFSMAAFTCTIASPSHAQSSVTLYGVIDEGINYVSNAQASSPGSPTGRTGGRAFTMTSSMLQGSRWGLTGVEDLGGGYKAIFTLENGFDLGTGKFQQGGTLFGRQAFVGIATPVGRVTLGRQYDLTYDLFGPLGPTVASGAFGIHPGDVDNAGGSYRINNSVKFTSNRYAGLLLTGMYSLGGISGNFQRNSTYSLGSSYSNGPIDIAVGYLRANNPNQSLYGDMASSSATGNNLTSVTGVQGNPIIGGFASARTLQVVDAALQYSFRGGLIGFNYSNTRFQNLNYAASGTLSQTNPLGYTGTATFNNYSVYGNYYISPYLSINGVYDYLTGGGINGKSSARYQLYVLGLDYLFSKRTDIYGIAAYMKASGTDSTGQPAVAFIFTNAPSNTSNQLVFRVAIRHRF
ncbi:porin [Burkholderia pseudomultivorans]|uniref:porin n=1 Tax=Burkholderia pseudomultivorans TaxID=1207504 RepID=UPI0028747262|nr:porin [Burkholderia pseudomultivorans]MDS0859650.1 porin [Burkholderia pseudomultivorans]